jgi:CRISPR-associated protein Cas1
MTTGHVHKNVELRIALFAAAADPWKSLAIAKGFIAAKVRNSRTMLRRHADPQYQLELGQLAEWTQKVERAESAETLLGLEGMAAKVYFTGFARLLKGDATFDFDHRNRRPPRDPVNALLSFVYALLVKEVTVAVHSVGFDPLLGFLHRPRYGRPSLALDLAEEFRPIIGDSVVMTLINNGEVTAGQFLSRAGSVALTEPGRKSVIAAFERRMEHEVTHPIFGYRISYRRVLEVQARLLSRVVLGELCEYPGFCTR